MSRITLKSANCNARVVRLVHDSEAGDWYVREPDQDLDDVTAFDVFEDAEAFYNERVKYWLAQPN